LPCSACSKLNAETPQEKVHQHAHHVMPFEMGKTLHVFRMTESGGVFRVVVRDSSDTNQIAMIRRHLSHEANAFAKGDYSDPAKLHGADMPGLAELQANATKIKVTYADLPGGAQISFETKELKLLTAIHRWFGAQLSEHGADAKAE
jgi:hypothetical protein